jgi:hypothetical protein
MQQPETIIIILNGFFRFFSDAHHYPLRSCTCFCRWNTVWPTHYRTAPAVHSPSLVTSKLHIFPVLELARKNNFMLQFKVLSVCLSAHHTHSFLKLITVGGKNRYKKLFTLENSKINC